MTATPLSRSSDAADTERRLRQLADDLASLASRLDAAVDDAALGDGLATMGLDQASQAIHLALIGVRDCVRSSSAANASHEPAVS